MTSAAADIFEQRAGRVEIDDGGIWHPLLAQHAVKKSVTQKVDMEGPLNQPKYLQGEDRR